MLTIGYIWEEYEKFCFFIMCPVFSMWLGLSGHFLLNFYSVYETGVAKVRYDNRHQF